MTAAAPGPLPDGTHLLHIGPQKTGSTAIQSALHRARPELAELGVMYPGPQQRPVDAAGVGLGFATPSGGPTISMDAWHHLLEQVHDPAYRLVCVSHEAFGRSDEEQAGRVVETLGGDRPHVVAVARRYDRLMPSQWQQRVKARQRFSYAEWLETVLGDPAPDNSVWRNLWMPHDTVRLVQRWTDLVGVDRFTLIVADDGDRQLLPRSFERMLGIPEGMLDVSSGRSNRSLSYSEVEVLRRVNQHFKTHRWSDPDYFELIHKGVIPALVRAEKSPQEPGIPPLPVWARDRLVELSDQRIEGLRGLGIEVVGDLDRLRIDPASVPTGDLAGADVMVSLDTVSRALEGMAGRAVAVRRVERRRLRKQLKAARVADAPASAPAPAPGGVRRAAGRLGRLGRRLARRVSR